MGIFKSYTIFSIVFFLLLTNISWSLNDAPVLTATGNQAYCPKSQINIVTDFNITDPDDTGIDALYIQISTGYEIGNDLLILSLKEKKNKNFIKNLLLYISIILLCLLIYLFSSFIAIILFVSMSKSKLLTFKASVLGTYCSFPLQVMLPLRSPSTPTVKIK